MPTNALIFLLPLTLSLSLTGCGTSTSQTAPCSSGAGSISSSGPEFLYGAPNTALLNLFLTATINANTGGFSSVSFTGLPLLASLGMIAVDAQFLYISAPLLTGNGAQIFGYSISPTNGAITPIVGSPFSVGPGAFPEGLATVPKTYILYAADADRIDAFTVDSVSGVPTAIPGSPFASGSNQQLVVDPSGKFLYASDDDPPGGVLAFTIDAAGALSAVPGSPFTIPGGASANSQPYGIVDTGSFVYTGLTAANQIGAFSIDSATGALTAVPGSPFPAGNDPTVLALANNFLYVVNEQDGSISGYSINPTSGVLTPVPGSPFTVGGSTLTVDVSGTYLYVSTLDGLQGYNIGPSGALTCGVARVGTDGSQLLTVVQVPSLAE